VSSGELFAITKGDSKNPAVVCLHGLLGSSRTLLRLVDAIAASGFYVIAYDQRGHGHSFHAADYSLDTMALDAFHIMDRYSISSAHLVGHSMGARVALAAAAAKPSRVKSLTLLDAGRKISTVAMTTVRSIIDPLPDSFPNRADADQFLSRFDQGLKQFLQSNLRSTTEQGGQGPVAWNFDLKGLRTALLDSLYADQTVDWQNVKCPTLVVRGEKSDHFSTSEVSDMIALNPKAKSAVIVNAGHWVHVDNFGDTSRVVVDFLKGFPKKILDEEGSR
jgi:esterase